MRARWGVNNFKPVPYMKWQHPGVTLTRMMGLDGVARRAIPFSMTFS